MRAARVRAEAGQGCGLASGRDFAASTHTLDRQASPLVTGAGNNHRQIRLARNCIALACAAGSSMPRGDGEVRAAAASRRGWSDYSRRTTRLARPPATLRRRGGGTPALRRLAAGPAREGRSPVASPKHGTATLAEVAGGAAERGAEQFVAGSGPARRWAVQGAQERGREQAESAARRASSSRAG